MRLLRVTTRGEGSLPRRGVCLPACVERACVCRVCVSACVAPALCDVCVEGVCARVSHLACVMMMAKRASTHKREATKPGRRLSVPQLPRTVWMAAAHSRLDSLLLLRGPQGSQTKKREEARTLSLSHTHTRARARQDLSARPAPRTRTTRERASEAEGAGAPLLPHQPAASALPAASRFASPQSAPPSPRKSMSENTEREWATRLGKYSGRDPGMAGREHGSACTCRHAAPCSDGDEAQLLRALA